ncbi:hypothetical protein CCYA_CCYA08G2378 [Cyanidiococcus yangmingshanensis]|nr:hypothetical protein CCYA_CCYA08G2378 [Cyanidiococcus yangmingshanensis]
MLYWTGVFQPSRFLVGVCSVMGFVAAVLIHLELLSSPLEAVLVALLIGFSVVTFRAFWDHVHEDLGEHDDHGESVLEFMSFAHLAVAVLLFVLSIALVVARGRADHHWAQASTMVCLLSMLYMACAGGHIYDAIVHKNYQRENAAIELVLVYDTWFPLAMNLALLARLAGLGANFLQRLVWEPLAFVDAFLEYFTALPHGGTTTITLHASAHAWMHARSRDAMRALFLAMRAARQGDFHLLLHVGCVLAGLLLTLIYSVSVLPVLAHRHGKQVRASRAAALKTPTGTVPASRTPATTSRKSRPRVPTPMTLRRKNLRSQDVRRGLQF